MRTNKLLIFALTILLNLSAGRCYSQGTYIDINPLSTDPHAYGFELVDLPVLNPSNSNVTPFYSYLWWMGDNGFSFAESPTYAFQQNRIASSVFISALPTGNYGTGGSPPIILKTAPQRGTNQPFNVLTGNHSLSVQNYRNAVVEDTMYLIVSYKAPHFLPNNTYSGRVRIDLPPHASIVSNMIATNPGLTPNKEIFDGTNSWSFNNLSDGKERSILVPVFIDLNEEEHLNFEVHLEIDNNQMEANIENINYFLLETEVASSHDPNQMIAYAEKENDCAYGGKPINYTVKFENIGEASTYYVKVVCQLDENLDMNTISNIEFPDIYNNPQIGFHRGALKGPQIGLTEGIYEINKPDHTISFEFHGLELLSPNDPMLTNVNMARDEVSFSIDIKSNFQFGPPIVSFANITFDKNELIVTNETQITCQNKIPVIDKGFLEKICDIITDKIEIILSALLFILLLIFGIKKRKK